MILAEEIIGEDFISLSCCIPNLRENKVLTKEKSFTVLIL